MTHYVMTEEQVQQSVIGSQIETAISTSISQADKMAGGGCNMTVVRTKRHGVCIYNEFQMSVAKSEIIEEIYSTNNGFKFRSAA